MKRITVYCGANIGTDKIYAQQAYEVGKTLAQKKITLVYGGGKVGLMGVMANAAMEYGGEVIGVIPHFLCTKEIENNDITEVIKVGYHASTKDDFKRPFGRIYCHARRIWHHGRIV